MGGTPSPTAYQAMLLDEFLGNHWQLFISHIAGNHGDDEAEQIADEVSEMLQTIFNR